MFDYPALAALAAIIREGSFERAAAALNVSPSAVSQRIKLLEERAGQTLVIRGQPCAPTEAGRHLCQHVEQVRLMETELETSWGLDREAGMPPDLVTIPIAVNADSLATWFLDAAAQFIARSGQLIDLVPDDQAHTLSKLRDGDVFAAVTSSSKPVHGCRVMPLGKLRYCAAAAPGFVAEHFPDGVTEAALSKAPGITFDRKDRLPEMWMHSAFGRAVRYPQHWLPSTHDIVHASEKGLGWALHPMALIEAQLSAGRLVPLRPDTEIHLPLYWQVRLMSSNLLTDLTRTVMRAARQALV